MFLPLFIFDDRAIALVKDVCGEEGLVQERHGGHKYQGFRGP